jgi:hypothetical protein
MENTTVDCSATKDQGTLLFDLLQILMGELDPLTAIPAYQLALPWSREAWRQSALCLASADTTL